MAPSTMNVSFEALVPHIDSIQSLSSEVAVTEVRALTPLGCSWCGLVSSLLVAHAQNFKAVRVYT